MMLRGFMGEYRVAECIIHERYPSKKNQVFRIKTVYFDGNEKNFVVKVFRPERSCLLGKEAEFLKGLYKRGVKVPAVEYTGENYIVMEYIKGPTFLQVLESMENEGESGFEEVCRLTERLYGWLKDFYSDSRQFAKADIILWDTSLQVIRLPHLIRGSC